jgi:hypothetical protein
MEYSGKSPVLMSLLVASEGKESTVSMSTTNITERFLPTIPESLMQQVVLLAATPRYFNINILQLLLKSQHLPVDAQSTLDWLQAMPLYSGLLMAGSITPS